MVKVFNESIDKSKVVESPKDQILDGVIVKIEKGLLSEFIDPQYQEKFDNLEQETLNIEFEVHFNDKILKGNDRFAYYEEPMSNSKLGKFIEKYDEFKAGVKIKIEYNGKGFGKIKCD